MSNDFEKALENMGALMEQSASVNASTAENLQTIGAKVVEHDKEIKQIHTKMTEYDDEIKQAEKRMTEIENNNYVDPAQMHMMTEHARIRIEELLGAKLGSSDWDVYAQTFYRRLWTAFKKRFCLPKYAYLRRIDYKIGLTVIDGFIPEGGVQALKNEVDLRNKAREMEHLKVLYRAKEELDQEHGGEEPDGGGVPVK